MKAQNFPPLYPQAPGSTRDALHGCAGILGDWLKACRPRRKHWWHASLRPSLRGLSTGVVHAGIDFELEIDMAESMLLGRTESGQHFAEHLRGQPPAQIANDLREFLVAAGVDQACIPDKPEYANEETGDYSPEQARLMAGVLKSTVAIMEVFRAGIKEETSPIQVWPHHFDLSMLWLPGSKVAGQDPDDEENSDKQLNFGFTFGDQGIPEPYFYITAYPLPDDFSAVDLPEGTNWHTEGFNGAVLLYQRLVQEKDPAAYLLKLWNGLLRNGQCYLV